MDPSSGSPPPPSDNEAATQHLKSLLGFFGVGVGASTAAAPVVDGGGSAGDAATLNNGVKMENGDIKDSLTNGVSNPTSPDLAQTDSSSSNRLGEASVSPLETGASDSFCGVIDQTNSSSADSSAEKVIKSNPTSTTSRAAGFSAAPRASTPATPPKNHDCSPGGKSERIELSGADEGNFYAISGERVEIVASEEKTGRTPGSNKVYTRDRRRRLDLTCSVIKSLLTDE